MERYSDRLDNIADLAAHLTELQEKNGAGQVRLVTYALRPDSDRLSSSTIPKVISPASSSNFCLELVRIVTPVVDSSTPLWKKMQAVSRTLSLRAEASLNILHKVLPYDRNQTPPPLSRHDGVEASVRKSPTQDRLLPATDMA